MVGRHERLKIWQKSYDLARDLMQVTERFPRPQQQGGLASEIRRASLDLIQTVMLANSTQSTAVNRDLDQEIDYLQVIVRLARDLRYISIGQYELLAEKIVELGKMNNGWMKAKRV
jgi:four helix bundle protein